MFQRIARRHEDRSDEPVASETADQPADDGATPPPAAQDPQTEAASSSGDAPTERLQAIDPATAPAQPDTEQPTSMQPAVAPPAQPSAPPPTATAVAAPTPVAAQAPAQPEDSPASEAAPRRPGFRARGRMRRRLRYLRKLRELQVRDLGGLVFDLRRFERKRDDLVVQKVDQIRACDDELRALERALDERRDLRDVREPGIGGTCPRCFAIYGSADRFCAHCGAALGGAVQGPAQVPATPPAGGDPQR